LLDQPVRDFLDQVAAQVPTPGGGGAAAVTAALAAGLVAMAARFSAAQLPAAADLAEQADQLRGRAAALADQDAAAYRAVLDAYRRPNGDDRSERRERIGVALHDATATPLAIAEIAAHVAELAADVAIQGNPNLRGDATVAAHLAEASARGAAALVAINTALGDLPGELSERAASAVAAAQAATARVSAGQAGRGEGAG
jgi:formiminotetrahydrofolate cyclodeaminase